MDYLQYEKLEIDLKEFDYTIVLNLVINGLPSILSSVSGFPIALYSFKPCYKWITFNTIDQIDLYKDKVMSFKPCYKWITFNTKISNV